ncbi:MAG: TadE/TadG family type IV pilus assembly protein [Pseudomonadota bacterium]
MTAQFKRFIEESRGVAAIEFSIVMPLLIFTLLGAVSIYDYTRSDRSVSHAANTVADLAARYDKISSVEMTKLKSIAQMLAGDEQAKVIVTNIEFRGGTYRVVWSEAENTVPITTSDLASMQLPQLGEYNSTIMVSVQKDHSFLFGTHGLNEAQQAASAFRRPLFVEFINLSP